MNNRISAILSVVIIIIIIATVYTVQQIQIQINAQEVPYNKTYVEDFIKRHGCNCTGKAMEDAARLIDQYEQEHNKTK
jgi:ribulose-5-phosphate 4-epimerase/fuculose-1-phosphate aldolase